MKQEEFNKWVETHKALPDLCRDQPRTGIKEANFLKPGEYTVPENGWFKIIHPQARNGHTALSGWSARAVKAAKADNADNSSVQVEN